jgi:hypothetical protein
MPSLHVSRAGQHTVEGTYLRIPLTAAAAVLRCAPIPPHFEGASYRSRISLSVRLQSLRRAGGDPVGRIVRREAPKRLWLDTTASTNQAERAGQDFRPKSRASIKFGQHLVQGRKGIAPNASTVTSYAIG